MLEQVLVRDVMTTSVETVDADATVARAARVLVAWEFGSVVVTRDGAPVGIVTRGDLSRCLAAEHDVTAITVSDVMGSPLVTVGPDASLRDAATLMRSEDVEYLPVVEDGELVGLLSLSDMLDYLPHLAHAPPSGPEHPDHPPHRVDVRPDTAFEHDDWEFEYLGDDPTHVNVGDVARFTKTLTDDDVRGFAEASGDTNRVHLDDAFAAQTRFGKRVAHGVLTTGLISAALARLPGVVIYLSQTLTFHAPVDVGDRASAVCEVVENLGGGRYRLSTRVEVDGEAVLDGDATVLVDEIPPAFARSNAAADAE